MAKEENLAKSMIEVIGKAGGYEAITKVTEDAIDTLFEDGVLKEIPIVKTIVGLIRSGLGVRELIFVRKIHRFLKSLEDVPEEKRVKFALEMEAQPDLREKVGTHLVLLLERMDELSKPPLLGRAFGGYLNGQISLDEFRRMARVIDRCFVEDMFVWVREPERAQRSGIGALDLLSCGVIEEYDVSGGRVAAPVRPYYRWTDFGQKFGRLVLR